MSLSASELKWWNDLKAVLRRMPKNIEMNARIGGEIGIARVGSRQKSFEQYGDADRFYETEIARVRERLQRENSELRAELSQWRKLHDADTLQSALLYYRLCKIKEDKMSFALRAADMEKAIGEIIGLMDAANSAAVAAAENEES